MSAKEQVVLEILVDYERGLRALGEYQVKIDELTAAQAQLKKEHKDGAVSSEVYGRAIGELSSELAFYKDGVRQIEKELKNNIKTEKAASDSIDGMKSRLSNLTAEYNRLGKSEADVARKNALGEQISKITAALNAEEQSLGNFRRQVGNYEVATKSIRAELKEFTEQITQMKMAGREGTDEYETLVKRAAELRDAYGDTQREINGGASDTKGLDRFKGSVDLLAGSFTALNSIQGVFSDDTQKMSGIIQNIQIGIGALSAATAIQNALQKEGAVLQGIIDLQSKARKAALAMEVKGTAAATVAQKIFNFVAAANPYVLLAMALITVVGALALFAKDAETAAEKQDRLNQSTRSMLDFVEANSIAIRAKHEETIKGIENEIALRKAQGVAESALEPLYQKLHAAKVARNRELRQNASSEIHDIEKNQQALETFNEMMRQLKNDTIGGRMTMRIGAEFHKGTATELIDVLQKQIDQTNKQIQVGVSAKNEFESEQTAEEQRLAARRTADAKTAADAAKERRQKELDAVRQMQDAILANVKEGQQKEIVAVNLKYSRQTEDLKTRLATEKNLSEKAKAAINETLKAQELSQAQEVDKIRKSFSDEQFAKEVEQQRLLIETRLVEVKKGSQEEHNIRMAEIAIAMDEEIRANAAKEECLHQDEQLIRNKYAAQMEQADIERDKAIIDKELEDARYRLENKILEAQMSGQGELQAKLEAKQIELDTLAQMEIESNDERRNRELKLASEIKGIEADIAQAKQQQVQDTLTAFGGLANSMGQIFENMAEDNAAMANFAKALALFEIGINTAKAIAGGIAQAQSVPFPGNLVAIVTTVATVLANIAQATAIVNKQKEPKAPKVNKYATGGIISGSGSGTSDSVPAMLSSGESVMTAYTTSLFGPILSSFNQIGGGVPIQVQQSSSQVMGEEMLARAFARGAASIPAPQLVLTELREMNSRSAQIEQLRTVG